jgi:hypothetical protein
LLVVFLGWSNSCLFFCGGGIVVSFLGVVEYMFVFFRWSNSCLLSWGDRIVVCFLGFVE